VKFITAMKAHKLPGRGCKGFLSNVVGTEVAKPSLQDIPVVQEFPNVFSKEIPGMPSLRVVEFCTDLGPGATPKL